MTTLLSSPARAGGQAGSRRLAALKILGYLRRMIDDRNLLLDQMALSHGQVRRVLAQLGLRTGDSEAQFDAWLKYVRRQGVPFYPNELGRGAGVNVTYRFYHVMELAVALALRTQGILPLDLLTLLMRQRPVLRPLYHQAYSEHDRGLGATLTLRCEGTADQPAGPARRCACRGRSSTCSSTISRAAC